MLGRRSFFKALGGTILGTAFALRLPDALVPRMLLPEPKEAVFISAFSISDDPNFGFGFSGFKAYSGGPFMGNTFNYEPPDWIKNPPKLNPR